MQKLLCSMFAVASFHLAASAQTICNSPETIAVASPTVVCEQPIICETSVACQTPVVYQTPVICPTAYALPACRFRPASSVIYVGCPPVYQSCRNSSVIHFGRNEAYQRGYYFNHRR